MSIINQVFSRQIYFFSQFNTKPNFYKLLEVQPNATSKQIEYSYYRLTRKYNPQSSQNPQGQAQLIQKAYIILMNQKLRKKYDQENGFNQPTESKERVVSKNKGEGQKKINMDKQLRGARKVNADLLGDKKSKMEEKIMIALAVGVAFSTIGLLFAGANKPKTIGLPSNIISQHTKQSLI